MQEGSAKNGEKPIVLKQLPPLEGVENGLSVNPHYQLILEKPVGFRCTDGTLLVAKLSWESRLEGSGDNFHLYSKERS